MHLNISWICFFSLVIRIGFIFFGRYLDNYTVGNLHYTDVDYHVFSDAALQVIDGSSPYERSTYRYPPLLAILLTSNHRFAESGKILFAVADVFVIYLIYHLLRLSASEKESIKWSIVWAVNPIAINICTRGSADSVTNWLVLLSLFLILRGKSFCCGVVLGLAIHLRIYPVIYCPAYFIHLVLSKNVSVSKENSFVNCGNTNSYNAYCGHLSFLVGVALSVATLTAASFHAYGEDFLEHAVMYHLSRSDHRHNFAPHFYGMYLSGAAPLKSALSITSDSGFLTLWCDAFVACVTSSLDQFGSVFGKVTFFIPQLALFMSIIAVYARNQLAVCALLQTVVFVTYNKVITAQYFTWFLCLVPVCGPVLLRKVPRRAMLAAGVLWAASCLVWLGCAYLLEFCGASAFHAVWTASLAFHLANVACLAVVVRYV